MRRMRLSPNVFVDTPAPAIMHVERLKSRERKKTVRAMRRVATTVRCVPRFGYAGTNVRTVDLDLPSGADDEVIQATLEGWFNRRGIAEAVFNIDVDDDGYFAVVNDEAFDSEWGTPLL